MKKEYLIGLLIILITIASFVGISQLSVTGESEYLDVCSDEQGCIDYLKGEGMPDNWLEENNIKISCSGGECYATK